MNEVFHLLFVGDIQDAINAPPTMMVICVLETRPYNEPQNATHVPILEFSKSGVPKVNMKNLETVCGLIDRALESGQRVLIHCMAGIERSPLVCMWWMHTRKKMMLDEAFKFVLTKRPQTQDRRDWLQLE